MRRRERIEGRGIESGFAPVSGGDKDKEIAGDDWIVMRVGPGASLGQPALLRFPY